MKLNQSDQRLKALLEDTISLLCKNGLEYDQEFSLEALVVLTVDNKKTFHASLKEDVHKPGSSLSSPTSSVSVVSPKEEKVPRKRTRDVDSPTQELPPKMAPKSPKAPRTELKGREKHAPVREFVVVKRNVPRQPIVITPTVIKTEPTEKELSKRPTRSSAQVETSPKMAEKKPGTQVKIQTPTKQPAKQEKANSKEEKKEEEKEKEEILSKRPTRSSSTPSGSKQDKHQETTPKRATRRDPTPSSDEDEEEEDETPQPRTTRRANKIAEEQKKIQTRGVAKNALTPVSTPKERPKRNASPATTSVTKKEKVSVGKKEAVLKSPDEAKNKKDVPSVKPEAKGRDKSVENEGKVRQSPRVSLEKINNAETPSTDKTTTNKRSTSAPAVKQARVSVTPITTTAPTKDSRAAVKETLVAPQECETITIDTRGVREITRIVKGAASEIEGRRVGQLTPIVKETSPLPLNYKQLKKNTPGGDVASTTSISAAHDYVKMSFASIQKEPQRDESGRHNGYEEYEVSMPVTQYTYGSGQKLVVGGGGRMSMPPKDGEQSPRVAIERQSSNGPSSGVQDPRYQQQLSDSAVRQIAEKAMEVMDASRGKQSTGSTSISTTAAAPSVSENALTDVVQQVMGNIDPMKVKNTTGSEGPIKVNFGLHQVKMPTVVERCPSCKVAFQSSRELYNHNCADQDQGSRKGTVFRCKKCSSMFMREENFTKHTATC